MGLASRRGHARCCRPKTMSKAFDWAPSSFIDGDGRREARELFNQAAYDARRLATFRRTLGVILIIVQTPVLVFSRSTDPTVKHVLWALFITWLLLIVPMVWLLLLERYNRQALTCLTARVRAQREPGRSSGPFRP